MKTIWPWILQNYRQLITIFLLVTIICLCAAVIVMPRIPTVEIGRAVAWLTVIALFFGGRKIWKIPNKVFWLVVILALAVFPIVAIARTFGRIDLLSILFHLGFENTLDTLDGFEIFITEAAISLGILTLSIFWLHNILAKKTIVLWLSIVFLATMNPMSVMAAKTILFSVESDLVTRLEKPEIIDPDIKPDLIIVYLEGVERTFDNTSKYGDAYSGILPLREESVELTSILQASGTGWSIAGVVASQCGLPLLRNGFRAINSFEEQTDFLINHVCLSDVLSDANYNSASIVGSYKEFAGEEHFLKSHGFNHSVDRRVMEEESSEDTIRRALPYWVFDDQMVFEFAQKKYDFLLQEKKPLFMMLHTNGPHGDHGVLSRSCTTDGQSIVSGELKLTIPCTIDGMLAFIDHIRHKRGDRPTVVIVMSDHLNHSKKMLDEYELEERKNTFLILPIGYKSPIASPGDVISRSATMMDVYPTILSYLGFASVEAKAGLGVSVFSSSPTIVEEKGLDRLNAELELNPALATEIWK